MKISKITGNFLLESSKNWQIGKKKSYKYLTMLERRGQSLHHNSSANLLRTLFSLSIVLCKLLQNIGQHHEL